MELQEGDMPREAKRRCWRDAVKRVLDKSAHHSVCLLVGNATSELTLSQQLTALAGLVTIHCASELVAFASRRRAKRKRPAEQEEALGMAQPDGPTRMVTQSRPPTSAAHSSASASRRERRRHQREERRLLLRVRIAEAAELERCHRHKAAAASRRLAGLQRRLAIRRAQLAPVGQRQQAAPVGFQFAALTPPSRSGSATGELVSGAGEAAAPLPAAADDTVGPSPAAAHTRASDIVPYCGDLDAAAVQALTPQESIYRGLARTAALVAEKLSDTEAADAVGRGLHPVRRSSQGGA
eukprot:gnl/TRDRNA2_/TRDRNA2_198055_c0_seq1.p1 gnl/TRDRNA2_/TRDRNA2_198055_c0~~gnl/TRDRNA2_/TRDRNA2_198055_c0_seq1.p1  ORF type:complete len:310 (-),score=47.43 gnl/TRDRNA2_/TRDRNA2_198055_c0_seq1:100-987(-)